MNAMYTFIELGTKVKSKRLHNIDSLYYLSWMFVIELGFILLRWSMHEFAEWI